jgi:signal transduction histidine kinase
MSKEQNESNISKEKLKALQLTIDKIEKGFGKGTIMKLGDHVVEDVPSISSGSISLDMALGVGGYPRGRVIEIYRDITERKKNEALIYRKNLQLTEVNRELEKLLKIKSEFLSLVSHELKSPLTVVEGYLDLFRRRQLGPLSPEQERALSVAGEEAEHLNSLINQILDLAQLDSGRFELMKSEFSVREVVDWCRKVLSGKAGAKKITFVTDISNAASPAFGDFHKIRQVFRNIMENALKFSPKKGKVLIRGEKRKGYLVYSIRDEGIGIPEGELDLIFDKFYQVKNQRSQKEGGIGLGLAISKNIIELHGGRIWAESGAGEGVTVYFTLPEPPGDSGNVPTQSLPV